MEKHTEVQYVQLTFSDWWLIRREMQRAWRDVYIFCSPCNSAIMQTMYSKEQSIAYLFKVLQNRLSGFTVAYSVDIIHDE